MGMERVTLRLPRHLVAAYENAEGNRSALMRRRLSEAVENGELKGVGEDLAILATREAIIDRGRLERERGKFKENVYQFFGERWDAGATPPSDADQLAESFRREAAIYGERHLAFVEAIVGWYRENWTLQGTRKPWPDAKTFHTRADPSQVNVTERLTDLLREARDELNMSKPEAIDRVGKFHDKATVEAAAAEVWADG